MVTMASKIDPVLISQSDAYSSKIDFFEILKIWNFFGFFEIFSGILRFWATLELGQTGEILYFSCIVFLE